MEIMRDGTKTQDVCMVKIMGVHNLLEDCTGRKYGYT